MSQPPEPYTRTEFIEPVPYYSRERCEQDYEDEQRRRDEKGV